MPAFKVAASDASTESKYGVPDRFRCDGTADDVQINLAIAVVGALGGGKVTLTEGTFTLAARINNQTYDNVVLEGAGREATIITAVNSSSIDSVLVRMSGRSDCSVRRLSIDGNKANQSVSLCGLYLENGNNCDAEDVAIYDTTHIGLYIESASSTLPNHIRRVIVSRAGDLGVVGGGSAGLQLDNDVIGSVVEDMTVLSSSGFGMVIGNCKYVKLIRPRSTWNLKRGISATASHLEIMNLYTADNGAVGIQILGYDSEGGHRINGGVTERNGFRNDAGSANVAVTITGGGGGTATLTDTREAWGTDFWIGAVVTCNTKTFTVTSNDDDTLTGTGGWSADPGADGQAWDVDVAFSEGSGCIITTSPHSVVTGLIARYNCINDGPNENGGIGVEDCDFVKLIGCVAEYNGGPGIFIYIACDCEILGCTAANNGNYASAGAPYGINLSNDASNPSSRNTFAYCQSYDDDAATQTHGLSIRPGAASSDNKVLDCDLAGNAAVNYDDSSGGVNNVVRRTRGASSTSGDLVTIALSIDHADITDVDDTGYVDFADAIPAFSMVKSVMCDFTETFNSDDTTTLTMMIGYVGDLDALNKTADPGEDAFNHATDVGWFEEACQVPMITTAKTVRVTFTEDNDITHIISSGNAQGKVVINITYIKA